MIDMMTTSDVVFKTGLKRNHLYRLIAEGNFPKPITSLYRRKYVWRRDEVQKWLDNLKPDGG